MNEHGRAQVGGSLEDGIEVFVVEVPGVDVRAYLHTGQTELARAPHELLHGQIGSLQRQGPEPDESRTVVRHHLRHVVVEKAR